MAYIVNGLTAQLINKVKPTGLMLLPALSTSAKSILTMIGYIIKNKHTAIGIDTTGAPLTEMAIPSSVWAIEGANLPSAIPPTMQNPIQTVK